MCNFHLILALFAISAVLFCSPSEGKHSHHPYSPSYSPRSMLTAPTHPRRTSSRSRTLHHSQTPASRARTSTSSSKPFSKVTKAPPGASILGDGILTLPTEKLQTTCSSSGIPLQTGFWVKGTQVDLQGGPWFSGKTTNWTFSTDTPGVVLGIPSVPAALDPEVPVQFDVKNRTSPKFFEVTIGPLVDESVFFLVFNDNGSSIQEDTWKLPPGKTESEITDTERLDYEEVLFQLNVTGYGACQFPVSGATCRKGGIELVLDTWMAYRVDDFLDNWLGEKKNSYGRNGLMEEFKSDFGIHTDVCNVQKPCESLQKCDSIGNPDSPDAIPIFLVYEAMANLANYFNMLYSNVLTDHAFAADSIGTIVDNFFPDPKPPPTDPKANVNPLQIGSLVAGIASFGLMAIPGIGLGAGAASGLASGAMGMGAAFEKAHSSPGDSQESQFNDAADLQDDLGKVVANIQETIEQWQVATLSYGTNFSQIFHGGGMINQQDIEFNTTATGQAAAWLEQYITVKLINHAWWMQNVFITFMPYGQVKKITGSPGDGDMQPFDEGQCVSNFLWAETVNSTFGGVESNRPILCSTDDIFDGIGEFPTGPGMARLTWYDPSPSKLGPGLCAAAGHGAGQVGHETVNITEYPHGFNQTPPPSFVSADGNYTFSVQDVIASSIRSWIQGGYNYDMLDGLSNITSGAPAGEDALDALAGIQSATPSDAGMFNLPVIVVKDLNNWPDFSTQSGFGGLWDKQKDKNGKPIAENGTLAPQLHDFITRYDGDLPVINQKC